MSKRVVCPNPDCGGTRTKIGDKFGGGGAPVEFRYCPDCGTTFTRDSYMMSGGYRVCDVRIPPKGGAR